MSIIVKKGKVSRTKKCIIDALFALMEEEKFDDITVTQITQEADIARRTFYLNYYSKYDVLADYINLLYDEYVEKILGNGERFVEQDVIQFFEFWEKHSELLYLLEKNDKFIVLLSEFEKILIETEYFNFSFWYKKGISEEKKDYIVSILATLLWKVMELWVKNDMKESATECAENFLKIID